MAQTMIALRKTQRARGADLQEIPIPEIPPLRVGILWRTPLGEVAEALIDIAKERARSLTATS